MRIRLSTACCGRFVHPLFAKIRIYSVRPLVFGAFSLLLYRRNSSFTQSCKPSSYEKNIVGASFPALLPVVYSHRLLSACRWIIVEHLVDFHGVHRRRKKRALASAFGKRGGREENPPIFGENVRQIYIFLPTFVGAPLDRGVLLQWMRRLSPLFADTQPLLRRPASRPRRRVPRCAIDLHQSC